MNREQLAWEAEIMDIEGIITFTTNSFTNEIIGLVYFLAKGKLYSKERKWKYGSGPPKYYEEEMNKELNNLKLQAKEDQPPKSHVQLRQDLMRNESQASRPKTIGFAPVQLKGDLSDDTK